MIKFILSIFLFLSTSALANTSVPALLVSTVTNSFSHCLGNSDTNAQVSFNDLDQCLGGLPSTFVTSFNTRTGAITLLSSDVTGALGYTPLSNITGLINAGTNITITGSGTSISPYQISSTGGGGGTGQWGINSTTQDQYNTNVLSGTPANVVIGGADVVIPSPASGYFTGLVLSQDVANNIFGWVSENQDPTGLEGGMIVDNTKTYFDIIALANASNPLGAPSGTLLIGNVAGGGNPVSIDPMDDVTIQGTGTNTLTVTNQMGNAQICLNGVSGPACISTWPGGGGGGPWNINGTNDAYNTNSSGFVQVNTNGMTPSIQALTVDGSVISGSYDFTANYMQSGFSATGAYGGPLGLSCQNTQNNGQCGTAMFDDFGGTMGNPNAIFLLNNSMSVGPADSIEIGQFNFPEYILSSGYHGINTNNPLDNLSVNGSVDIGGYAGTYSAPSNGLIVQGQSFFGTPTDSSMSGYQMVVEAGMGATADIGDPAGGWFINPSGTAQFGDHVLFTDGTGTIFGGFIKGFNVTATNANAGVGWICQNGDNSGYCTTDYADDAGSFQADQGWSNTGGPYSGGGMFFETKNGYPIILTTNSGTPDVEVDGSGDLTDIAGFINGQNNIFAASSQVTMQNDATLGLTNEGYQAYAGSANNMVGAIYDNTDCTGGAGSIHKNDSGVTTGMFVSAGSCGMGSLIGANSTYLGTAYTTPLIIGRDLHSGITTNINFDNSDNITATVGGSSSFNIQQGTTTSLTAVLNVATDIAGEDLIDLQNNNSVNGVMAIKMWDYTNTERASIIYDGSSSPNLSIGTEAGQPVYLSANLTSGVGTYGLTVLNSGPAGINQPLPQAAFDIDDAGNTGFDIGDSTTGDWVVDNLGNATFAKGQFNNNVFFTGSISDPTSAVWLIDTAGNITTAGEISVTDTVGGTSISTLGGVTINQDLTVNNGGGSGTFQVLDASLSDGFLVNGDTVATLNNSLDDGHGNMQVNGGIYSSEQSTPPSIATNDCGVLTQGVMVTSPSSTDEGGAVTVGTAVGSITSCKVTFGQTHTSAPASCVVNDKSAVLAMSATSFSSTSVTFSSLATIASAVINYSCKWTDE